MYSSEGKPAISPVILSFITIFQFVEKYPDRQAAEAMRMRIDWKYALHLPLDYFGFDFSVLSEFRDRMIEHEAEQRVFVRMVKLFQAKGLIKERGKQRTDSIAMLTKVRNLSRLELVVETLRLAVGAILEAVPEWGEALIPPYLPEVQVLKTVWAQQFRECEGQITYQKLDHYDGHTQIHTPHDPEARYSKNVTKSGWGTRPR